MAGVTQDITDLGLEVTDLGDDIDVIDGEVAVLFAEQVIQDERILELEADSEGQILIQYYYLKFALVKNTITFVVSKCITVK